MGHEQRIAKWPYLLALMAQKEKMEINVYFIVLPPKQCCLAFDEVMGARRQFVAIL
jgi:hypothetical protein